MLKYLLWENGYFKLNNKILYHKNWIKSGFIYVKEILTKMDNRLMN